MFGLLNWILLMITGMVVYRIVHLIQRARLVRWLKTNGMVVIATVTNVQKQLRSEKSSLSEKIWDMVPYYAITAQWRHAKTKQVYTFKQTIRGPLPRTYVPGHSVAVLIDPNNPKHYHLEL